MRAVLATLVAASLVACSPADKAAEQSNDVAVAQDSTARLAFEAYTVAINSNNTDSMMAMMTDDVIFLTANSAPIAGAAAVRAWIDGYVAAYTTHWEKTSQELVVNGDHAYERYSYKATDTPKAGGAVIEGTGWGLIVYRKEADGKWRVARDAFASDQPLATTP